MQGATKNDSQCILSREKTIYNVMRDLLVTVIIKNLKTTS